MMNQTGDDKGPYGDPEDVQEILSAGKRDPKGIPVCWLCQYNETAECPHGGRRRPSEGFCSQWLLKQTLIAEEVEEDLVAALRGNVSEDPLCTLVLKCKK